MVRNYVRKTTRGDYSKHTLEEAIEEIKAERINAYKASKKYSIPLNTIMDHLKGRRGIKSKSFGRSIAIPVQDEKRLADGLLKMEKYGFGLSRKEVLELVGQFVKKTKIKTPFKNGIPGEDWFLGFLKRNKLNLSLKKPQSVEVARKKSCNPFTIDEYFSLLYNAIKDLRLENKPSRIWNLDETSFCTDPSKTKVVGGKNLPCTRTVSASGRENITVLLAASASGDKVPPLIIFKGKNIWNQWHAPEHTGYPGTTYAATTNGWMEAEVFENYFEKSFLAAIGTDRPVLLIYDGHSTHISIRLIEMASQQNVTILKLPPHTSHVLQPLDISVIKTLKTTWDQKLVTWQRKHIGVRLPKKEFSRMIGEIWNDLNTSIIKNGFQKAGISPFSRNVIPDSMYSAISLKKWKETKTAQKEHKNSTGTVEGKMTAIITEAVIHPPIMLDITPIEGIQDVVFDQVDEPPTKILEIEETSPVKQIHSSTNIEPGPSCPSLIQQETVTFEDLLLDSIKPNAPHVFNKRRKVASGAEVITAEEIKRRIVEEKKLKQKCIPISPVSTTTNNDNDNLCSICKCDFRYYINKKDWIQCVTCIQWVCGVCNKGSKKRQYQCERCLDSD